MPLCHGHIPLPLACSLPRALPPTKLRHRLLPPVAPMCVHAIPVAAASRIQCILPLRVLQALFFSNRVQWMEQELHNAAPDEGAYTDLGTLPQRLQARLPPTRNLTQFLPCLGHCH